MSGRHRRERLPPHLQDQFDAADTETEDILRKTAASIDSPVGQHTDHDGSDPVLDAMLDQLRAAAEVGQLTMCPHATSPQPLIMDWCRRPWKARCGMCSVMLPPISQHEECVCDNCGRYDSTGLWPMQIKLGAVLVSLGRCDDCVPASRKTHR